MNEKIRILGNLSNRIRLGMLSEEKAKEIYEKKVKK